MTKTIAASNGAGREDLATKADFAELRAEFAELRAEFAELRRAFAAAVDRMMLIQILGAGALLAAMIALKFL